MIIGELDVYHKKYPLRTGMPKEEIRSKYLRAAKPKLAEIFIDSLIDNGELEQKLENIKLKEFEVVFNSEQEKIKESLLNRILTASFLPPRKEELLDELKVSKEDFEEIFNALVGSGEIIKLSEELFLPKSKYIEALDKLKNYILEKESISIGEYRDLLDTNRKVALGLLEYFDQLKITKRDGEKRKLII